MIRILIRRTGMLAASTALTLGVTAWALAAEPKVGDKAPAFELQG